MCPIVIGEQVRIPPTAHDLEGFREWARSDDFPEHGWYSYLKGDLWVDVSMERIYHNLIKLAVAVALSPFARKNKLGLFLGDGVLLTNIEADLSTEPDGMFFFHESLANGQVVLEEGEESLEVIGTPDMVLEVVSKTSVKKDTVILRDLYWQAGIAEYWLVDTRDESLQFDILRRGSSKYLATRKQSGWLKSNVFGKSFKLTRQPADPAPPQYVLKMQ